MKSTCRKEDSSEQKRTLCIVLHYGDEGDTNRCIASLANVQFLDVVVSDNDPRQSYVPPHEFRSIVSLIKTGGSAGFSEGNNLAANAFLNNKHDSVLILNNDTIVNNRAISCLRTTLSANNVGAVGPCMHYASDPDKVWACGGYISKLRLVISGLQEIQSVSPYEVDYLPGAAILVRAEIWKKLGGLPETYFLAYEEAEFAMSIRKLGYKVMVDPRSVILHKVGMSSQQRPEYFYNAIRNRIIFSKYLFGSILGFIYGMGVTVASVRGRSIDRIYNRLRLWVEAISDEARGVALNREALTSVSVRYKSY